MVKLWEWSCGGSGNEWRGDSGHVVGVAMSGSGHVVV